MSRRRRRKIVDTQTYIVFVETDEKGVQWVSAVLPDGQPVKVYDNEIRAEVNSVRVVEAVTSLNNHSGLREIESIGDNIESTEQLYEDAGLSNKQIKLKDIRIDRIILFDF
jgi:hypothetical protein